MPDCSRVTSYSALRGYCVLFCFAYSSSCFTIETYEHRQVASTSGGATNAYSRGAKSGEMGISAVFTKSTGSFLFFTSSLRMAQESSIKIPPPKSLRELVYVGVPLFTGVSSNIHLSLRCRAFLCDNPPHYEQATQAMRLHPAGWLRTSGRRAT